MGADISFAPLAYCHGTSFHLFIANYEKVRNFLNLTFADAVDITGALAVNGGALTSTGALTITPAAGSNLNIALATTFEGDEKTATVEISIQFLSPAGTQSLEAEGRVTRRGKRLSFAECVIRAPSGDVARAQGICYASPGSPTP